MSSTQQTLLERIRNPGDNLAWGEFFRVYEPLLLRYVFRLNNDRRLGWNDHDVHELVQDIFIKLYRTLPGFRLDHARGRFRTWLWRITTNAVLDKNPARKSFRRAQQRGETPEHAGARRPKVHDEGQVDLNLVAAKDDREDQEWITAYRAAILERVLEDVRREIEPTNPNKWASFAQQGLAGRPAAEVAAELGINANLVYQNTARVMQLVRKRCLEEYEEDLADECAGVP